MVKSGIPIPLQCSVSDCSVRHLPRTHSYLLPDKLPPIYPYNLGIQFFSPSLILRRPGRSGTQHRGPGHKILGISFIPIKTCLREHQLLPLAHHEALRSSTITSSIKSTPTTLPRYYKNTHFAICFNSLFSFLTTIVLSSSLLLIPSYRFDHGPQKQEQRLLSDSDTQVDGKDHYGQHLPQQGNRTPRTDSHHEQADQIDYANE